MPPVIRIAECERRCVGFRNTVKVQLLAFIYNKAFKYDFELVCSLLHQILPLQVMRRPRSIGIPNEFAWLENSIWKSHRFFFRMTFPPSMPDLSLFPAGVVAGLISCSSAMDTEAGSFEAELSFESVSRPVQFRTEQ